MIRALLRSRGMRKLRKNRPAIGALVVIGLYLLLALWIAGTNAINDIGKATGAFSLEDRPIAGMLLRSRLPERVGPNHLAGFGVRQSPEVRSVHYRFYIDRARAALDEIDRLSENSDLTIEEVRELNAVGERRLADVPVEELRRRVEQAEAAYAEMVETARRNQQLAALERAIRALDATRNEIAQALAQGVDEEQAEVLKEDLSLALEDIAAAIEDYQDSTTGDDPLAQMDPEAIYEAAERVYDADGLALDLYDHDGLVASLSSAIEEVRARLRLETGEKIDAIEAHVLEIYPEPTGIAALVHGFKTLLGTDRQGRSILVRALYSSKIAVQVGFIVGLVSVIFGSLLGAAAAFYGRIVDGAINWLFSVFTSIPSLVLLVVLAFAFTDSAVDGTLIPLYVAFCITYWIGPCRVVRGETMKIKELEYVQAATAMGFSRFYILLRHVIPNTVHLMFINFSLLFIGAIKGEVILTYLGLGVKPPATSWGIMIRQSIPEVPTGNFWQIGAATFFMFVLVLAFNIVSDALQDAFDPKHQG